MQSSGTRISKQSESSQSFWLKCNEICETNGETYTSRIDIYPETLAKPYATMVTEHSAHKRKPNNVVRTVTTGFINHEKKRNVGRCWVKSLTEFKLHTDMRPTSCHIAQRRVITTCYTHQCWVMLCQHVAFVWSLNFINKFLLGKSSKTQYITQPVSVMNVTSNCWESFAISDLKNLK